MVQGFQTQLRQGAPRFSGWLCGVACLLLCIILGLPPQDSYADSPSDHYNWAQREWASPSITPSPTIEQSLVVFTVNSFDDDVDGNIGDGVCVTLRGVCTLRAAIQEANASYDTEVIHLSSGTYRLSIPGRAEDKSVTGDLDITRPVTLLGSGSAATIIDGGGLDRVLDIGENAHPGTSVTIAHLAIRNGSDNGENAPAGIRIRTYKVTLEDIIVSDNFGEGIGIDKGALILKNSIVKNNNSVGIGGIRATSSSLLISESTISENKGAWGGIASDTWINVVNSTISGNKGSAGPGGLRLSGSATITNSTISSNIGSEGAAIWINNGNLIIINSTIVANQSSGSGGDWRSGSAGGIFFKGDKGSVILAHTILAENISSRESPNCYGTLLSMGYNLIDKLDGCHFIPTETDLINTPPLLGPLQNNGGTSFTHAPLQNSAAIDGGSPRGCTYRDQTPLLRDQRNHTRPYDGNGDGIAVCDIGAVEYDGESTVVVLPTLTPTLPSGELVSQPQSTPVSTEPMPTSTASAQCRELVVNGGFESQEGWVFPQTAAPAEYAQGIAHSGKQSVRTGILSPLNNVLSYSSIWQPVVIPSDVGKATLSFWVYPVNTGPIEDYHGGDLQLALLLDYPYWSMGFSPLRQTLLSLRSNSRTWTHYEYDLTSYAGRKIWLYFGTYNNGWAGSWGSPMAMYVDDVSLLACSSK